MRLIHAGILGVLAAACAATSRTPADEPPPPAAEPPCLGGELRIAVDAPEAGEPVATLEIDRGNPILIGRDAKRAPSKDPYDATCLRTAEGERRIPPRTKVSVPIAASDTQLARLRIGDAVLLVEARSGTELSITDNPCFFWELDSSDIDPWGEGPPLATCADVERECPNGYDRLGGPGPADDPLCGDKDRRCVRQAVITMAGEPAAAPIRDEELEGLTLDRLRGGTFLPVTPRSCGFDEIDADGTKVLLAPDVASRWELTVDTNGEVGGTFSR